SRAPPTAASCPLSLHDALPICFVRGEAPPHREDPVSLVPCQRDRADHEQECEQSSHAASEQSQHSPIPLQPTDRLYPSGTDAIRSYRAPVGDRWLCIRSISRTWTRACAAMSPRIVSSARNSPAPASRTVRPSVMWGWNARSSRSKPRGANAHSRSCLRPRSGGEASTPSQRTRGRRSDGNAPIPPTCSSKGREFAAAPAMASRIAASRSGATQPRNLSVTWNDVASTQRTGKPASRRGTVASCNASRTSSGRFSATNSLIIPARACRPDALLLVGDQFQCDVAKAQRLDLGRERRQDSGRFARRLDRRDLGLVPRGAHHGALDAPLAEQPHYGGDAGGDVHHRTAWRRTRGSPSFSAPRRYPSTSSKTRSKPTSRSSRASAPACAIARSISTGATSIRAASPWRRTRNSR